MPRLLTIVLLGAGLLGSPIESQAAPARTDPFLPLAIYDGEWSVRADHPWSGAAPGSADHLTSRCQRFTLYFACEQTINGKPTSLLVYTDTGEEGRLNTRTIAPNGLAGGRGDLTIAGARWTYLDKPPATLAGNWSRVENLVKDRDHIRFEEYESADQGKTWTLTNSGDEVRQPS